MGEAGRGGRWGAGGWARWPSSWGQRMPYPKGIPGEEACRATRGKVSGGRGREEQDARRGFFQRQECQAPSSAVRLLTTPPCPPGS